jgi:DnaK suppressor protein
MRTGSQGRYKHMTKTEMKKYRKKLLKLREDILYEMRQRGKNELTEKRSESGNSNTGYATHMADLGTDTSEMEFMGNILSSEQKTLFEIDEALLRIDEGTYGKCSECNRAINKKRLDILPYARYCKRHEEAREKS